APLGSAGPMYPNYATPAYAAQGYAGFAPAPVPVQPAPMAPPMRSVVSPPLMPAMGSGLAPSPAVVPLAVNTLESVVQTLRSSGDRRVAIAGTARNAGTTYAAIVLARMLAHDSNVVLVDLAF